MKPYTAYLIGIDQGTQSTKAVIYDDHGAEVGSVSVAVNLKISETGWVTQSADELFTSVLNCIISVMDQSHIPPGRIAGIAICSQISSLVAVDNDWQPVGEVLSHLDNRSDEIQADVLKKHGSYIVSLNGNLPYISSRLLWLKENRPSIFRRIKKALLVNSFIIGNLCALKIEDAFVDFTCMNVYGWGNISKKCWESDLCVDIGLDPHLAPHIREPGTIIGGLSSTYASKCGLLAGTPIISGGGDATSGWLGAGAVESGSIVDTSGTANHLAICVSDFTPDIKKGILGFYPSVIPNLFYMIGFSQGTGRSHRWFIENIASSQHGQKSLSYNEIYKSLDSIAKDVDPGANGLFFIPHFRGRMCPVQPDIRGGWLGISWQHEMKHLYRAILESIAFEYELYIKRARQLNKRIELKGITIIGGGAKSTLWSQIKADVLNLPCFVPKQTTNFATLGNAIQAGCSLGIWEDIPSTVKGFLPNGEYIYPIPYNNLLYKTVVPRYHRCVNEMEHLYRILSN